MFIGTTRQTLKFAEALANRYNGEIREQRHTISFWRDSSHAVHGYLGHRKYRFDVFSEGVDAMISSFQLREDVAVAFMKPEVVCGADVSIAADFPKYAMPIYISKLLSDPGHTTEFLSDRRTISAVSALSLNRNERLYIGKMHLFLHQMSVDIRHLDNRIIQMLSLIDHHEDKSHPATPLYSELAARSPHGRVAPTGGHVCQNNGVA